MLFTCRCSIVVEMVYHHRALVSRNADIEFEKRRLNSSGCGRFAREGNENVSFLLQEFENVVRGKRRTKTFRLRGEENDMVVCSLSMSEE